MSRKLRIGGIVVTVLLLVGTVGYAAFADTTSNSGADKSAGIYQSFVSKLATNLGLDQDKVKTALDSTKKQMLDEAVQQGKITQQQADKMAQDQNGFGCGFAPHAKGKPGDGGSPRFGAKNDAAASILGITADQLKSELSAGKKLDQIVTEHGLTMEQFKQKMLDNEKAKISQDVANGKLTQEQADKMLQRLEKRMANPAPQNPPNTNQ